MTLISLDDFPNSLIEPFLITSPQTNYYNCIAWAFGDNTKWYWPEGFSYWPPDIRREVDIAAFIELYELAGYQVCENPNFEPGLEKIAIFALNDGTPTHAAKQLNNGNWTSKMGEWHDVEHTLNSMNDSAPYGNALVFMSRIIKY